MRLCRCVVPVRGWPTMKIGRAISIVEDLGVLAHRGARRAGGSACDRPSACARSSRPNAESPALRVEAREHDAERLAEPVVAEVVEAGLGLRPASSTASGANDSSAAMGSTARIISAMCGGNFGSARSSMRTDAGPHGSRPRSVRGGPRVTGTAPGRSLSRKRGLRRRGTGSAVAARRRPTRRGARGGSRDRRACRDGHGAPRTRRRHDRAVTSASRVTQKSIVESSGIQPSARATAVAPAVAVERPAAARRARAGRHVAAMLVVARHSADGEPGQEGGAERRRLAHGRDLDRALAASASACTNVGLRGHAAVDAQHVDRAARVGLGGLDEVGAALGDALEHRAHDLRPPGAAGEAEQRAARAVVPLRRAEPEQRGHVPRRRRCRRTRCATSSDSSAGRDDAEVVAQPLDVRAGRRA